MSMISATPNASTASISLKTTYPGTDRGTIWRYVNNIPMEIRGFKLTDGREIPPEIDYEAPLGVQVGYSCTLWVEGVDPVPTPPAQPELVTQLNVPDNEGWLKFPAFPERNFRMGCITELPEREFESNVGMFRVIGRKKPVAVHDVMTWWKGSVSWLADSVAHHDEQVQIITSGDIMLLQTMPAYGGISEFISPDSLSTAHTGIAKVKHPERTMSLEFRCISEPVGTYLIDLLYTYDEVLSDWGTYNTVKANYSNYYSLLRDYRAG